MKTGTLRSLLIPHAVLTPSGLVLRGAFLVAAFAACHLAGWREYTSFLCGMDPAVGAAQTQALLGFIYVFAFLGSAVVAPVLLLAAAILWVLNAADRREAAKAGRSP